MPQYVQLNGLQYVQLDDNTLVPVNVSLSLEGGTLVKLSADQIAALQNPNTPSNYPLPPDQVASLKAVQVTNLPNTYVIANFPTGFDCTNQPSSYPLPSDQAALLAAINNFAQGLSKGLGPVDANTLKTVEGYVTPSTIVRSSVTANASAVPLVSANSSRLLLKIYNDSSSVLWVGFGTTTPSATSFTVKMFPDSYYEFSDREVRLQVQGIWSGADGGAARITEGF